MATRYDNRLKNVNNSDLYRNTLRERGVRKIVQYATPNFARIRPEDMESLTIIDHIWSRGDHFYKLANQYYGDPTYWWVIAQFNKTPTEAGISFGDVLLIPNPLEQVLTLFNDASIQGTPPAGGY